MTSVSAIAAPLRIGPHVLSNRVFLAPLSGVTDEPMRARAVRHGAGLVVSEMVASAELARGRTESGLRMKRPDVPVHVVQLAGRDAEWMAEGARIATGEGADIIDINMGCPAKKVTTGYCGSALMREPELAIRLVEAVVGAVGVPVTVKMRLGWDETALNAPVIARRAEQAGAAMITVHGRTREQFYKGSADWRAIARVRDAVSVPLVANGDIASMADARAALELSGADAVMVGRAHYGRPWFAGRLAAEAAGTPCAHVPATARELADYVAAHYEDMLSHYGAGRGLRHARKHLGWYAARHADGMPESLRTILMTSVDPAEVLAAIATVFDEYWSPADTSDTALENAA